MALGDKRFTRIPPESTGDRVYMIHTAEIEFATNTGGNSIGYNWKIGGRYTVTGFGTIHLHGVYDKGDGTGILSVHYSKADKFENNEPSVGQTIVDPDDDGSTRILGEVVRFYDVYIPAQNIMGYDNPEYGLDVDPYGSALVTLADGRPTLDAFGKLRTTGATHLGEYVYSNIDELLENYSLTFLNKGARSKREADVFFSDSGKYIEPRVKEQQDFAAASSNTYHHYIPGSSHLFMGTMLFSDTGKVSALPATNSGVERNFGLFDADNGFMFRVGPTGVLYLVRRSSVSGSVKNYILASSDTSDGFDNFNGDLINGSRTLTNRSQMDFDLSKDNIFWIDVQWHGAGRVRFGTFNDGQRLVIHEYFHGNRNTESLSATASLPACQQLYYYSDSEMQNHAVYGDGSGTDGNFGPLPSGLVRLGLTSSRPEDANYVYMRSWSASVWTETDIDLQSLGRPKVYTTGHLTVNGAGFRPLFTISPKELLSSGAVDHSLFVPTKITAYAYDNNVDTAGEIATGANRDAIVHFRIGKDCVHSGHDFQDIPGTNFQISTAGTSFEDTNLSGNTKNIEFEDMFNGQFTDILTDRYINLQNGAWKNRPDDGGVAEQIISDIDNSIETTGVGAAVDAVGNSTTLLLDDQTVTTTTVGTTEVYSTTIEVADATGFVIGGSVTVLDTAGNTPLTSDGTNILDINGNVLTLTKPIQNKEIPAATTLTHIKLIEGGAISGTNIPANTAIRSVDSGTQVTLSSATTGTFTGAETFTMTRPPVVTIDPADAGCRPETSDRWLLREPQTATFPLNENAADGALHCHSISSTGIANPFPRTVFIKIVNLTKAYLYEDRLLTIPVDTTDFAFDPASVNPVIHGFTGSRSTWTFFAHEQIKDMQDPRIMFSITWKEILQ